jgi:hypothetical protein
METERDIEMEVNRYEHGQTERVLIVMRERDELTRR